MLTLIQQRFLSVPFEFHARFERRKRRGIRNFLVLNGLIGIGLQSERQYRAYRTLSGRTRAGFPPADFRPQASLPAATTYSQARPVEAPRGSRSVRVPREEVPVGKVFRDGMSANSCYWPISNSTLRGEVFPDAETVMEYSPSGSCGTVKFTWN